LKYSGSTGSYIEEFVQAGSGGLLEPTEILFGPDSNLYVCDRSGNNVLRYDGSSGEYLDEFISSIAGGLNNPSGMAFGPDGKFYVSSSGSDQVLRYEGSGALSDAFITSGTEGLDSNSTLLFLEPPAVFNNLGWNLYH
jgi:DNA-binding beta-propeller fold protein YncE